MLTKFHKWLLSIALIVILAISTIFIIKTSALKKRSDDDSNISEDKANAIETLVRQASRWSVAAQQDESPLIALLHANYGAGYLWAIKDIASDQEIHSVTGIDVIKFRDKIVNIQDNATQKVSKECPQFVIGGDMDKYLLELGGDL
jgi:hypothetical protein